MGDPVPAVTEDAATGDVAEAFADIRATLGIPVVNLIWRHLATIDGGLDWAWQSARPIYESGHAAAAAAHLTDRLPVPMPPPLAPGALAAVGVAPADVATVRTIAAAYNQGNGLNLLALGALIEPPAGPRPIGSAAAVTRVSAAIPKVLSEADMPPHVWDVVGALNLLGARPDEPVMATLYRHLAHWPGLLALMHTGFAPLDADGRLAKAIALTRSMARAESARLAHLRVDAGPAPPAAVAAIEEFTEHVIARMVPICLGFSRWIDDRG